MQKSSLFFNIGRPQPSRVVQRFYIIDQQVSSVELRLPNLGRRRRVFVTVSGTPLASQR
jgi:hypothetical protein